MLPPTNRNNDVKIKLAGHREKKSVHVWDIQREKKKIIERSRERERVQGKECHRTEIHEIFQLIKSMHVHDPLCALCEEVLHENHIRGWN